MTVLSIRISSLCQKVREISVISPIFIYLLYWSTNYDDS